MTQLFQPPSFRATDANGDPVSGARLFLFVNNTTTPLIFYADAALTTPHPWPLMANSAGVFAPVYTAATLVKVLVTSSNGAALPGYPVDNVDPAANFFSISFALNDEITARIAGDAALQADIDALSSGVLVVGEWDASSGAFPTTRPGGGAIQAGDAWIVTTSGTVDSVAFVALDRLVALGTGGATYAGNWLKAAYSDVLDGLGAATVTPTGGSTARALAVKLAEAISVKDFGAKGDGVLDTNAYPLLTLKGGYTGTDDTAAIQAAITAAAGRTLRFPPGKYLIKRQPAATWNDVGILTLPAEGIEIVMDAGAEILIDFDPNENYSLCDLFRSPDHLGTTNRYRYGPVTFRGGTFRSLWSVHPSGGGGDGRVHLWNPSQVSRLTIDGVTVLDLNGKASRTERCGSVRVTGCRFERIASDTARFVDCDDVQVIGNEFRHIDDDCVAIPLSGTGGLPRSRVVVSDNTMEDCEGILVLGARSTTVTGNTLDRCKGTIIFVGGRIDAVGDVQSHSITISGNVVTDPLNRTSGSTITDSTLSQLAITAAGSRVTAETTSAAVGLASGGAVQNFIALDTGGDMITDNYDGATKTLAPGMNMIVADNSVLRTLPAVTNYSDWNRGQMFTADGFIDPAVTDAKFVRNGVGLVGQVVGASISGNVVQGLRGGAGVFLSLGGVTDPSRAFTDISIKNNIVRDCMWGFSHTNFGSSPASPYFWTLFFDGNHFDLDPYHIHPSRTSPLDGTWDTGASVFGSPIGYVLANLTGAIVRGGSVANSLRVIYAVGAGDPRDRVDFSDIAVLCDPAAAGLNSGNKGVGDVGRGGEFHHVIVDCDPASANFRTLKNTCPIWRNAVPTSGKYVQGHVIRNTVPAWDGGTSSTVWGWLRQTTGTGHTVGTTGADWIILRTGG